MAVRHLCAAATVLSAMEIGRSAVTSLAAVLLAVAILAEGEVPAAEEEAVLAEGEQDGGK